jgi:hypothetical protein
LPKYFIYGIKKKNLKLNKMKKLLYFNVLIGFIILLCLGVKNIEWLVVVPIVLMLIINIWIGNEYLIFIFKIKMGVQNNIRYNPSKYFRIIKSPILSKDESILMAQWAIHYFDFEDINTLTKLCKNHFENSKIDSKVVEILQKNNRDKYLDEVLSNICIGYKNSMFFKIDPDWLTFFGEKKFTIAFSQKVYKVLKEEIPRKHFEPLPVRIKNVLIDFTTGSNYATQGILIQEIKGMLYILYDKDKANLGVSELP